MTKNILIVDDEPKVAFFLKEGLESLGQDYTVSQVQSAEDALSALARAPYDLVVTDLRMSGMNGLDLLTYVRRDRPYLPTILITAYGSDEVAAASRRLRTTHYFTKPFRMEEFLQAVQEALTVATPDAPADRLTDKVLDRITQRLQDLRFEAGAQCVALADQAGHVLAEAGIVEGFDLTAAIDIIGRNFEPSIELQRPLREERAFNLMYHEGARFDIYASNVDTRLFVAIVFDRRQGPNRIGVVWLYTKRAIQDLQNLLARSDDGLPMNRALPN